MCLYTLCMSGALRGAKKTLDPLLLELQTTVGHQMSAGNQSQVLMGS